MEVDNTSMIHAGAPHFLLLFVVRYAAEKLNLLPRVSHPQTSPTLRWTGEVGDASAFHVCGSLSLVRNLPTGKLSPRTLRPSASTFFTPTAVPRYSSRLSPWWTTPLPPVAPLPPPGPAPSAKGGDQTATDTVAPCRSARLAVPPGFPPRPSSPPLRPVAVDSGAAGGGDTKGADSGGAASPTGAGGAGGAAAGGSAGGGAGGAGVGGAGACRQETLSLERLPEWAVCWSSPVGRAGGTGAGGIGTTGGTGGAAGGRPGGGAGRVGAAGSGGAGPGGASAGVPGVGRAGGTSTGGTGATGGTGSAGHVGASAVVPGVGGTSGADTGGATGGTGVGGSRRQESLSPRQLREWAVRWGSLGGGAGGAGSRGAVPARARESGGVTTQPQLYVLRHLLSLPPATTEFLVASTTPPLMFPPTMQSQPQLLPGSPLSAHAPNIEVTESFTERRESASRPVSPVRSLRAVRPRPPPVPSTHIMALRPSSVPQHVVLPSPPASSLPHVRDPESDLVHTATPTVTRLLATVVTDPSFESATTSALVAELVDFAALCRLDYAASLVFYSSCPPSVGGELALGCDILEDRQFELECLAVAAPHLASTLLFPKEDPDALDIPTPRTYAETITSSPPGANIVDGMRIFRVKRPPDSPPAFKAHYVARGFSQREGVDFYQTFSPTPKMTTLRVLLHVATQRDYELHSLDFLTTFLQGSLHEAIWLRRPHGFTGSFPEGT
ncbi:unnamed protein product [Closterium sp. NIES-53]